MTSSTVPLPTRVLFLGGIGRSGTTLLERSVSARGDVVALGEVMHLWERCLVGDELCGCGLPFSTCGFWVEVGDRAFGGWRNVDPQRMAYLKGKIDRALMVPRIVMGAGGRAWRDEIRQYVSHYERIYRAASEITGADVLVDSSKQVSLAYLLMTEPRLDVRVLHCVRDSRAVAFSWTKQVRRPEARDASGEVMQQYSPVRLSAYWMVHNTELDALGHRRRGTCRRLRYEDWIEDPVGTVRRVRAFAGLDPSIGVDHVDARSVSLAPSHTCSGNPMRFRVGKVELRVDHEWMRALRTRDFLAVTVLTWPLLARYRYSLTRRRS